MPDITLKLNSKLKLPDGLQIEDWPTKYVSKEQIAQWMIDLMRQRGLTVQAWSKRSEAKVIIRLLIGTDEWSRKAAIHLEDQPGIIYALHDDGEPWRNADSLPQAVKAVSLNGLVYSDILSACAQLEGDQHRNTRLAPAKS